MFRKIANVFVLILFIVSTTGFTISKHYCHGNLVSVSINVEAKSCCDMSSCNCCHNENEFLQLKNDFAASQYSNFSHAVNFEIFIFNIESAQVIETTKKTEFAYTAIGPPFKDRQFIYYIHQLKLAPPIC